MPVEGQSTIAAIDSALATVNGKHTLNGWSAFYFAPSLSLNEAELSSDLNRDGDREDVFDLGRIRLRSWDAADPKTPIQDVGLGPNVVLQERCRPGGDLDGDGFADPLLLWNASARRLHVRLFCAGQSAGGKYLVRRAESTIFLRNAPSDG